MGSEEEVERRVVARCLHGHRMPSALKRLWEAKRAGDLERLELLDSLDVLDEGYGAAIAAESEDTRSTASP
jgi:hypothetical protein